MPPLRALYVTERFDGPYRYRCQQACAQLRADGAVANVAHIDDSALLLELPRYGAVVLFRLPWSERVEAVVIAARRAGLPVLFDMDDLVFDPTLDELMPFRSRYGPLEWAQTYGRQMVGLRRTLDNADAFIGSTPELALHAARLGKKSHVHRNVVPESYLESGVWTERIRGALRTRPTIGYFSGSDTHDEDFASIAPALVRVLASSPDARLLIVGYLDLGGVNPEIERHVVRLPYMHWRDFALAYAACHVTLAPLAMRNAFTDSKSALKFFEAGAFFTPTVATPVREMAGAISNGETGFLATTEDEWTAAIQSALTKETSARVGRAARLAVERGHSMASQRGTLRAILDLYAVEPAGAPPDPSPLESPNETGRSRTMDRVLRPGRAIRDVIRVVRAARRAPKPAIHLQNLDRLLDALRASPAACSSSGGEAACVLVSAGAPRFKTNDQVAADGALPGELHSKGGDPQLTLANLALDPKRYRYLLLRLRVRASSPSARAQIFWGDGNNASFSERSSVTLSLTADGFDRSYLIDLHDAATRAAWHRARRVTDLRVDPMDRAGSFRVDSLVLLPESFAVDGAWPLAEGSDTLVEFDASQPDDWTRIERELATLREGAELTIRISRSPESSRRMLTEWLPGTGGVATRLFVGSDGRVRAVVEKRRTVSGRDVDIVVPVWNAKNLVLKCLVSVVTHARGNYRLVVVDDASTDQEMFPALEAFARQHDHVIVLRNSENLGFVGTANRGIAHAGVRDVLLLNSDTEVYAGFLERLRRVAYSESKVGMVSPLSNNATICSVPEFCRENDVPDGMTGAEMAATVALSSEGRRPELVTPHGFCLYLRRDCLDEIGVLDEERFGRGFGEENDLGERAKNGGFKILLADDVYVWHAGKASFGDAGKALERRAQDTLERRHPGYRAAVAAFIRDNPLAPVHANIRRHLARRSHRTLPAPLFVLHGTPFSGALGGIEYCVRDLVRATAPERAVLLYPEAGALEVAEIFDGEIDRPSRYRFPLGRPPTRFCHEHPEALRILDEILALYRIGWAHVHHTMFLPLSAGRLFQKRGIPYVVTVHDFYLACPSYNLLDPRTTTACCPASCGNASRTAACHRALCTTLGESVPADPVLFVERHRRLSAELLYGSVRVLFPSPSTRRLTGEILPLDEKRAAIVPHGYDPGVEDGRSHPDGSVLRVAILGQVAHATKGAAAYLQTMALTTGASIEWHVFGPTTLFGFEQKLAALGPQIRVIQHGSYDRAQIVGLLRNAGIELALLLPPWPETFSYTLSEIEAAGVPVVARRVGALADRLEGARHAILVDDPEGASQAVMRLAKNRDELRRMAEGAPVPRGTKAWGEYHRSLYAECAELSDVKGPRATVEIEYRRLNELATVPDYTGAGNVTVTRPAFAHTAAWWFSYAERAKPYVPESLRHIVRRRLAQDGTRPLLRFRLPGRSAHLGQQLTLDQRYVSTALLTSHGSEPQIFLDLSPLDPRKIHLIRFNLWCEGAGALKARLYFKHEGARDFDDSHSITFSLDGRAAAWQEYAIRLDESESRGAWYEGGPIDALRFDPIDREGPVGLGELALCEIRRP